MSDKTFEILNKYYTYSKKYFPFVCLGIFLIIAFCKVSTILCISVYFGLMLAHLVSLAIVKRKISNYVYDTLKDEANIIEGDLTNATNDTKESN